VNTEEGEHDRVAWFWIIAVAFTIGFAIGGFVTWATYRSEIHDVDYKCKQKGYTVSQSNKAKEVARIRMTECRLAQHKSCPGWHEGITMNFVCDCGCHDDRKGRY
jgi:hypothetical protein